MRVAVFLFVILFIAIAGTFLRDMAMIRARLAAGGEIVQTRLGAVEVATRGEGPAVLALHGAGGGYDQGLLLARAFGGEGYQWIAPSRFGYLRSPLPEDASTAAQADLIAAMLDEKGVGMVSVVAMSGGVPPALQLASRYPERVACLVLLSSAPFTPFTAEAQDLPVPITVYNTLFGSNFPYWFLSRVARPVIEPMFDIRPDLRAAMSPEERAFVKEMIASFEPVLARMDGLRNEGAAIDPKARYDLEKITAPTVIIHARDDRLNPVAIAERLGRDIKGARTVLTPTGGHLLLGHHAAIRDEVRTILAATVGAAAQSPDGAGATLEP
jgi:pimeloyl-ACP methyl ester carboxylesterase